MDYAALFHAMNPGFFQQEHIRSLPAEALFAELTLDLRDTAPPPPLPHPAGITFGEYHGPISPLRQAVAQVNADWVQFFGEKDRFFCALDGERIAAFCVLDDMGRHGGLRIGGPGCVGTIPAYRRQSIGLEMVRQATEIFRQEGFDLSWIHYTHLWRWYGKLGYQTVLWWNGKGFLDRPPHME